MAKTLQEKIAVMQAFAEGKQIEYRRALARDWYIAGNPTWDWWTIDYRIAPEPVSLGYQVYKVYCSASKAPSISEAQLKNCSSFKCWQAVGEAAARGEFKCE